MRFVDTNVLLYAVSTAPAEAAKAARARDILEADDLALSVQVQSSWFPLVNLNPQTFVRINEATEADFRKATQRVWRTAARPSLVRLSVVGG